MNSFSNVTMVGRLTRNAEMRTTSSGVSVVSFALAIDRRRRDADGNYITETTFVEVSHFGQNAANVCPYLEKGVLIGVCGELNLRRWEGKDGTKNQRLEVLASNVHLLESKSMRENRMQSQSPQTGQMAGSARQQQMGAPQHSASAYGAPAGYGGGYGAERHAADGPVGPDGFDDDDVPF